MRVLIHVRQYLSSEGFEALPSILEEHRKLVSEFEGFVSLKRLYPHEPASEGEFHLALDFESEGLLMKWRSSPQHVEIAERYKPYWTRDPDVDFYNVENLEDAR